MYPADVLEVVGDDEGIESFSQRMKAETLSSDTNATREHRLSLVKFTVSEASPILGRTLVDLDIREQYHCMAVGIEDRRGNVHVPQAHRPFQAGDILWVVGEDADLSLLRMGI